MPNQALIPVVRFTSIIIQYVREINIETYKQQLNIDTRIYVENPNPGEKPPNNRSIILLA